MYYNLYPLTVNKLLTCFKRIIGQIINNKDFEALGIKPKEILNKWAIFLKNLSGDLMNSQ